MIAIPQPIPKPDEWDEECLARGKNWLETKKDKNPKRPQDYWSPFRRDLRRGFNCRCGYYAVWFPDGQMDHFISWKTCKQTNQREKAYDWDNFRFVDGALNSRKKTLDGKLLDPLEVKDGWFEVQLPTLHLRAVNVPPERADAATLTLERLELDVGLLALELRWEWYDKHQRGVVSLEGLREVAPLVAAAVERWDAEGRGALPVIPRPVPDPFTKMT